MPSLKKVKSVKETRRKQAEERNNLYNSLSINDKIKNLDLKFGKDQGAKKERSKLLVLLSKPKQVEKVISNQEIDNKTIEEKIKDSKKKKKTKV